MDLSQPFTADCQLLLLPAAGRWSVVDAEAELCCEDDDDDDAVDVDVISCRPATAAAAAATTMHLTCLLNLGSVTVRTLHLRSRCRGFESR